MRKKSAWSRSTSRTWPHFSDVSGSVSKIYVNHFCDVYIRFEDLTSYNGQYFSLSSADFLTNRSE